MMKKLAFLIAFWSLESAAQVKSNVVLFTEDGEKFTAILNGLRINEDPATHVKITDLAGEFFKLKVIFDDTALGEEQFNLNLSMQQGHETTCNIKRNKKGKYVLRFMGSVPVAQAPASPAQTKVVTYHEGLPPAAKPAETVTQQTVTTTTTSGNPENVNISMGIQMGDQGASVQMNVTGTETTSSSHSSATVTHSTTTTSGPPAAPAPAPVYLPGYTGPVGCQAPLSPKEFNDLKRSVSSKTFEESKMTIARQVVGNACLFTSQVKQLMALFTYEDSKLEIAKISYSHTYDIGNYFKVNDEFTFESSIDELNEFIESQR